jgi:hypothetical protein
MKSPSLTRLLHGWDVLDTFSRFIMVIVYQAAIYPCAQPYGSSTMWRSCHYFQVGILVINHCYLYFDEILFLTPRLIQL